MRHGAKRSRGSHVKPQRRTGLPEAELAAMIEAATVDCYNESEETTGWLTMIQDNLTVPFETRVLGVQVRVQRVTLDAAGQIVAVCARGRDRQVLPILDLPLPSPRPEGAEWIQAYCQWLGRG